MPSEHFQTARTPSCKDYYMKKTLSLLILFALTACNSTTVIPGSTIKTRTKTIVYTDTDTAADTNLDSRVAVYPITPNLIEKMRKPPVLSQNNKGLEQSKSAYRYRIGSGDVLNIMVWAHSDLNSPIQQSNPQTNQVSRGAWVDEGGYITYPLAGKIQAKGKTLDELQNTLTNLLKRYIKNPQVAINVTEFRSQRISVSGAINQAGGVTQSADTQHIKWTHNGVDRTISLQDMLQYGDMSQNHLLSHGDIVYVPNSSNNKIYIMGEVGKQATLPIGNHGLNLTQALGEVGGMNQAYADATGVFVIRRAPEDAAKPIHIYQLNLKDATSYALGSEFKLRSEDTVYVTAAPVTRWNRVMSQITNSISNVNTLDNTFK